MTRPTKEAVSILDSDWFNKINNNFEKLFEAPFPIHQLLGNFIPITITSPDYPSNYPDSYGPAEVGNYTAPAGETVGSLNFDSFNTESLYDKVIIKDISDSVLAEYSGNIGPFISESFNVSYVSVWFESDSSANLSGFSIDGVSLYGSFSEDPRLYLNCLAVFGGKLYVSDGIEWKLLPFEVLDFISDLDTGTATVEDIKNAFNLLLADMRLKGWMAT